MNERREIYHWRHSLRPVLQRKSRNTPHLHITKTRMNKVLIATRAEDLFEKTLQAHILDARTLSPTPIRLLRSHFVILKQFLDHFITRIPYRVIVI